MSSTPPSTTNSTTSKTPFPSSSSSFRPFPLHNPSTPSSSSSPTPLSPPPPPTTKATKPPEVDHPSSTSSDGPTVEVVKRPRGRPPGSKNKPKPPPTPTSSLLPPPSSPSSTSTPDFLRPHIFEIPTGHDVASSLSLFSCRRDVCLAVLAATGAVSNVTLRNPSSSFTFHGRFDLLSISATFLLPSFSSSSPPLLPSGVLSVSLAGPQGRLVGGIVSGPLVAAGTVTVIAAAFSTPTFHRLPSDEELSFSVSVSGDANPPTGEADGTDEYPHRRSADMTIPTSSHLLSDVILRGQHTPPYP